MTLIYVQTRPGLRGSGWKRETLPNEKDSGERRDENKEEKGKERGVGERNEDR